jgi:hypothetical protein
MLPPTKKEILAELRRELSMRKALYPKWIKSGRMHPEEAAKRIAALNAALTDFETRYFGVQPGLDL